MYHPVTIAVDFDGTIVQHRFPEVGDEIGRSTDLLKKWQAAGAKLTLWSCRCGYELQQAMEWCRRKGLMWDSVNSNTFAPLGYGMPKVVADLYIDDRSIEHRMNLEGYGDLTAKEWEDYDLYIMDLIRARDRVRADMSGD